MKRASRRCPLLNRDHSFLPEYNSVRFPCVLGFHPSSLQDVPTRLLGLCACGGYSLSLPEEKHPTSLRPRASRIPYHWQSIRYALGEKPSNFHNLGEGVQLVV